VFRIQLKNVKNITLEKKKTSGINEDESIDGSDSFNQSVRDPKKMTTELDNDEEYESRKGVTASLFQRMFRRRK
jgi:hypothetical protein